MSLEAGGRASKLGHAYERLWAVKQALRVIGGLLQSLLWEPIGDDGEEIDIWLQAVDGRRIGCQLKRQIRDNSKWSVSNLQSQGVPSCALRHLKRNPNITYRFVSTLPVPHLKDFVEQVGRANDDPEHFYHEIVCKNKKAKDAFHELLTAWELDAEKAEDRNQAFAWLRRMEFKVFDSPRNSRKDIEFDVGLMFSGESSNVVSAIEAILESNLGKVLHADQLLFELRKRGFQPRDLAGDPSLSVAVESLQRRFDKSISQDLIASTPLERPEVQELLELISSKHAPRLVFVHGGAGSGKSVVVHQLFKRLEETDIPCLPIQLDVRRPEGSPNEYGRKIELPTSPALSLRALAGGRRAVLILDQLDALRMAGQQSQANWECCAAMIEEALRKENTTVVLVCRTFDLKNDPNIKKWKSAHGQIDGSSVIEKEIGDFPEEAVAALLSRKGVDYASLSPPRKALLRNPFALALWWKLAEAGRPPMAFKSRTELVRALIEVRRREAHQQHSVSEAESGQLLTDMVEIMEQEGRLDVPKNVLGHSTAIEAYCSLGLLRLDGLRVSFAHQGYFDYLAANAAMNRAYHGGADPMAWVRRNQSLYGRDRLRHLLYLLRDSDEDRHQELLRGILLDADVRFHLKHLVLGLLAECDPPKPYEVRLVAELAENKEWWPNIQESVLWSNVAWFDALYESGHLARWMASWTDEEALTALLRTFRLISDGRGEAIDKLFAPYWERGNPWDRRLWEIFWHDPSHDSPGMAEFRWRKVRSGEWALNEVYLDRVADRTPSRVVSLIDAALQIWFERVEAYRRNPDQVELPSFQLGEVDHTSKVLDAVRADPARAWESFARKLRMLTIWSRMRDRKHRAQGDGSALGARLVSEFSDARQFLEPLVTAAVEGLARNEPDRLFGILGQRPYRTAFDLDYAVAKGLLAAPEERADAVIAWLLARDERFRLGKRRTEITWGPAQALLQRFSPHCSDAALSQLEAFILTYHDPWEIRTCERQTDQLSINARFLNDWGRAQNVLLGALPWERLSKRAQARAAAWRAKFGDPKYEEPMGAHTYGGMVTSPIPPDRLMFVTDSEWLRIIAGNWPVSEARRFRRHGPGIVGEATVRAFAGALGNVTKRDPNRFAALALRIPRDSDPAYFTAILQALAETEAKDKYDVNLAVRVIEHVGECADSYYACALCQLVKSRDDFIWPDSVIQRVIHYVDHPDPAVGECVTKRKGGKHNAHEPNMESTSLNCVRGRVSSALRHLLWTQPKTYDHLLPAAMRLLADAHPAVRMEALGTCQPIMRVDRDLTVRLLLDACGHADDRVLESRWLGRSIGPLRSTHLSAIAPILLRMMRSEFDGVAELGAAWLTVCWADNGHFAEEVGRCRKGSKAQRLGVAAAAIDYVASGRAVDAMIPPLCELFNDEDHEVRSRAAGVFRGEDTLSMDQGPGLAEAFVKSRAYIDGPEDLLFPLSEHGGRIEPYSTAILWAADRVSNELAEETRDLSKRNAMAGDLVATLLLRLYDHSVGEKDTTLQDQCLDRWDLFLRNRVGRTQDQLKELES